MLAAYLMPFLLALLFSLLLEAPIKCLEGIFGGRRPAARCVFGLFLSLSLLAFGLGFSRLLTEAEHLLFYLASFDWPEELLPLGLENYGLELLTAGTRFLRATPEVLLGFFVTLFATYYLALEPDLPVRALRLVLPSRFYTRLSVVYAKALSAFAAYLRAQAAVVLCTTLLSLLGLRLLGVDYVLLLALLLGFLDLLPMLGPGTLLIPWAALSYWRGEGELALGLLALYGVIILARQLVEPRIMGAGLGLHPLAALAAGFFGLSLFGAFGLLLGPLLASLSYFVFCESRREKAAV